MWLCSDKTPLCLIHEHRGRKVLLFWESVALGLPAIIFPRLLGETAMVRASKDRSEGSRAEREKANSVNTV